MRLFISPLLLVFSTSSWAQSPEDMRLKSELEYLNIESVKSAYTDFCKTKGYDSALYGTKLKELEQLVGKSDKPSQQKAVRACCSVCENLIPYVEEYDTDEDCGGTYEVEIDETPYCPNCGAKIDRKSVV